MRAVVQRVDSAAVEVEGAMVGSVGKGLLVLLGVEKEDTDRDLEYLLDKVAGLRIFEDEQEKMHIVLRDVRTARYKVSDFVFNPEEKKFIGRNISRRYGYDSPCRLRRNNTITAVINFDNIIVI